MVFKKPMAHIYLFKQLVNKCPLCSSFSFKPITINIHLPTTNYYDISTHFNFDLRVEIWQTP